MNTPTSDERLRELERRFRQTGAPDDEAAWLTERARVGALTRERLELAACCGHMAAGLAFRVHADWRSQARRSGPLEVTDMRIFGREAVERACIATCRLILPCWQAAFPRDLRLALALDRAEEWVLAPGTDTSAAWVEHLGGAEHDAARALPGRYESAPARAAVAIDYAFAGVLHGRMGVEVVAGHAREALARSLGVSEPIAREQIGRAIAADLVPWALGYADPLRERVERRRALNQQRRP